MDRKKLCKKILPIFGLLSVLISNYASAKIPAVPDVTAKSYVLMEYSTGTILEKRDELKKLEPASLTKVMTAYVVFDELKNKRISLEDQVKISVKAWNTKGSRTYVKEGTYVSVEDLVKGMIVQSGNDASVALAEHIAGTTSEFSKLMNYHAKKIGMKNSFFKNPTGLSERGHYTTALDLSLLAQAIIRDFPEYYYIYSMKKFTYNNIPQSNRNRLLFDDSGFDGMKTGFTNNAGYCYIGTAKRGDTRMIIVLLDDNSPKTRFESALKLVNYGFRFYETHAILKANTPIKELNTPVINGEIDTLLIGAKEDINLVLESGNFNDLEYKVNLIERAIAPIKANEKVGDIKVFLNGNLLGESDLISLNSVEKGSFSKIVKDYVRSYFKE